jgi:hypothetical protein
MAQKPITDGVKRRFAELVAGHPCTWAEAYRALGAADSTA